MLSDFFRSDLVRAAAFDVVDRKNMDTVLKEQEFAVSGCTDTECAVKIGKLLNVGYIFVGTVSIFARKFVLTVDRIRVETGKLVDSARETTEKLEELLDVVKTLALRFSVSAQTAGKPSMAAAAVAQQPPADKPAPALAETKPATKEQNDAKYSVVQSIVQGTFRKDPDWMQVADMSALLSMGDRMVLYKKYEKGWTFFVSLANIIGVGSWVQGDILGAIILDAGLVLGGVYLSVVPYSSGGISPLGIAELYGLINPWLFAWGYNEDLKRALKIITVGQAPQSAGNAFAKVPGLHINLLSLRY
jgi:TolB-like protein